MSHKLFAFFCTLFFLGQPIFAQEEYAAGQFISSRGDTLKYRFLRPQDEDSGKKYPLVLFLHGAGERENDNEKQLTHGGQMFLNPVNREKHPAFILFPQCPPPMYWGYPKRPASFDPEEMPAHSAEMTPVFSAVKELLDTYLAMPQVDTDRVYVMGLSMGAMGTFDLVVRHPEIFAAAIPICGSVHPGRLKNVTGVSFRIFHGDNDKVVSVEGSRKAYKALKAAGCEVEYIEFAGRGHDSWYPAYNYPGFMEWLFSRKKKN